MTAISTVGKRALAHAQIIPPWLADGYMLGCSAGVAKIGLTHPSLFHDRGHRGGALH